MVGGGALTKSELMDQALQALEEGNLVQARSICARALDVNPDDPVALHWSAVIDYQLGNLPASVLERLNRAIKLDGSQALYHNSKGAMLYALGRDLEAAECFYRATELAPGDGTIWNNLGNALLRLDRIDDAETCYRQALGATPGLVSAINNLGVALKRRGQLDKALVCFREAVRHDPDYLDGYFNLGELLHHLGEFGEAEGAFRRCLEISPDFQGAYASLAQTLHDSGKSEAALEVLQSGLARFPGDQDLEFSLRLQMSSMAPAWHIPMVNDEERNQAYEQALKNAVKPGDLVLEIGTGSGLVSMMAARAGAGKVVTCEVLPVMADLAREIVERNGFGDRIAVLNKKSTQLRVGEDLPHKADIFVSELINIGMLAPGMLSVLQHARENLVKPGGKIIPATAIVHAAVIECEILARVNPLRKISGFDLSPLDRLRSPGYAQVDLAADPHRLLSKSIPVFEFDFRLNMPERNAKAIEFEITTSGTAHGIVFWFDLIMDDETVYSSDSRARTNHWKQAADFFREPVAVQSGGRMAAIAGYDNTRIWFKRPD